MERANSANRPNRVQDLVLLRYAAQLAAAGLADPEILARAQPESVALLRMAAAAAEAGDPAFTASQVARARLCKDMHLAIDSIEQSASGGGAPASLQRSDSFNLLRQAAQAAEAAVKSATEALRNAGATLPDDISPRRNELTGMTSSQARLAARVAAYQKAAAATSDSKQPVVAAGSLSPRLTSPRPAAAAAVHTSPRLAGSSSSSAIAERSRGHASITAAHIIRQTIKAGKECEAVEQAAAAADTAKLLQAAAAANSDAAGPRSRSPVAAAAAAALAAAAAAPTTAMEAPQLASSPLAVTHVRQASPVTITRQQQQQQQRLSKDHGQRHMQQQQQQQFEQLHEPSVAVAGQKMQQKRPLLAATATATETYVDDEVDEDIFRDPSPMSRQGTRDNFAVSLDGFFMKASPSSSVAGSSRRSNNSTSGGSSSSNARFSSSSGDDSICSSGGGWRGMLARVPLPKSLFAVAAAAAAEDKAAAAAAAAAAVENGVSVGYHCRQFEYDEQQQQLDVQQQRWSRQQQQHRQKKQKQLPAAEPAGIPRCSEYGPDDESTYDWQQQQQQQQHCSHKLRRQQQQCLQVSYCHRESNYSNENNDITIFVPKQQRKPSTAAAAAAAAAAPAATPSGILQTSSIASSSSSAKSSSTPKSWVQALIEHEQAAAQQDCSHKQQQQQQRLQYESPGDLPLQASSSSDLDSVKRQQQLQQLQQLRKHRVAAVTTAHRQQQQQQQQFDKPVIKPGDYVSQGTSQPASPDGWRITSGLVSINAQQQLQQVPVAAAAAAAIFGSDVNALATDHMCKFSADNNHNNMLITSHNSTPNSDSKNPLLLTTFDSNTSSTLGQQQQQQPGSAKSNDTFKSSSGSSNASTESAFKREANRHWHSSSKIKRCLCILLPLLLAAVLVGGGLGAWAWHRNRKGSVAAAAAGDMKFDVDIEAYATREQHCGTWFGTQSDIDAYQDTFTKAYSSALNITNNDIKIDSITCNGSAVLGSSSSSQRKSSRRLLAADDQLLSSIKAAAAATGQTAPAPKPGQIRSQTSQDLTNSSSLVNITTSFTVAAAAIGSSEERQAAVNHIIETQSEGILAEPMSQLLGVRLASSNQQASSSSSSSGATKAASADSVFKPTKTNSHNKGVNDEGSDKDQGRVSAAGKASADSADSANADSSSADLGGWDPETSWPAVWPPPAPKPSSSSSSSSSNALAAAAPAPPVPKTVDPLKQQQKKPSSSSSSSSDTQDTSSFAEVLVQPEGDSSSSSDGSSNADPEPISNIWLSWEAPSSGSTTAPAMFSIQGKPTNIPQNMTTVPLPEPNSEFAAHLNKQQDQKPAAAAASVNLRSQQQQQQQLTGKSSSGSSSSGSSSSRSTGPDKQAQVSNLAAAAAAADQSLEGPLPAVFPAEQLDPKRYKTAPTCHHSPGSSNSISDSQGRLWGWMSEAACLFRSPKETSKHTSHSDVSAGCQNSLQSSKLTWQAAPPCSGAPTGSTAVYDREGKLWGWQNAASCAFRGSNFKFDQSEDRRHRFETVSTVWENAPVCGMAPTLENTMPDIFGRFWGEEPSGSCAFRVDRV